MNYLHHPLPGPGYGAICAALALPSDSNVNAVLAEIERLKMAAAEGPQSSKSTLSTKSTRSIKRLLSTPAEDLDTDKETA